MRFPIFLAAVLLGLGCVTNPQPQVVAPAQAPDFKHGSASVIASEKTALKPIPASAQTPNLPDRVSVQDLESLLPASDLPLAKVGEQTIRSSDLASPLFFHFSPQANELLRKLVNDQIARQEAKKHGITVKAQELEHGVQEALETLKKQIEVEYQGQLNLEQFLEREFRVSLSGYETSLRRFVLERLFFERVIRYDQLLEDRIVCRVITVRDRRKAEELLEQLRQGADFEALARQESIAPNRDRGGKLPPFGPSYEHPIASFAFQVGLGELGGPYEEKRGEDSYYHLVRVLEKVPKSQESYQELESRVRKGLEERAIEEWEYFYWSRKMEKLYSVQYFGR